MRVYQLKQPEQLRPRAHPWTVFEDEQGHRYHDFLLHPGLIRRVLEDFEPWRAYPATETFFKMLEWVNGAESTLATNDCAFSGPEPHDGTHSQRRLEVSGRVMLLFRDLEVNTAPPSVEELTYRIAEAMSLEEPDLEDGILGVSVVEAHFTTLRPPAIGQQLMLSFWSWGDDPYQVFDNLNRIFRALSRALRSVGSA